MKYILQKENDFEYYTIPNLKEFQLLQLELLKIVDKIATDNKIDYWLDGGTLLGAVRHGGFIPWDDDIDICLLKKDFDKFIPLLVSYVKNDNSLDLMYHNSDANHWAEYFVNKKVIAVHNGVKKNLRVDILPVKLVKNTDADKKADKYMADTAGFFTYGKTRYFPEIKSKYKLKSLKEALKLKEDFFHLFMNEHLNKNYNEVNYSDFLVNYPHNDVNMSHEREYYTYSDIFPLTKVKFEGLSFSAPANINNYLKKLYNNYNDLPKLDSRKPFHQKIIFKDKPDSKIGKTYLKYQKEYFYYSQKKYFKLLALIKQLKSNGIKNAYSEIIKPFIKRGFKFKS